MLFATYGFEIYNMKKQAMKLVLTLVLILLIPTLSVQTFAQKLARPGDAYNFPKCLGLASEGCKNLMLSDGGMIKNPRDPSTTNTQEVLDPNAYEDLNYYYYYPDSEPHEYETGGSKGQGLESVVEAFGPSSDIEPEIDGEAILCNDPRWNGEGTCIDPSVSKCPADTDEVCYTSDGDLKNLDKQPYCDEVDNSEDCWDRKDYDQETGLYPCKDGSYVGDWRDCDDDRDDEGSDGGDEENNDEETENCGGEPCTATEKEDSWVDDETEYYEEEPECREDNDGALGDPVPCE